MSRYVPPLIFLACATVSACGMDGAVEPNWQEVSTAVRPLVSQVRVSPAIAVLIAGEEAQLVVSTFDARGQPVASPAPITYSSSASGVAEVSPTGRLVAVSPGTATVSARVTSGKSTLATHTFVQVVSGAAGGGTMLVAGRDGWEPASVRVAAGSLVTWVAGPVAPPMRNSKVWLMDADYRTIDSLDLSSGSASFRVGAPGTLRYCSGACWDASEFGIVHID